MPRIRDEDDEDEDRDDDHEAAADRRLHLPLALRPKDAAAALGLSLSTLERGRKAGWIRAGKFGRAVVYRWEDLAQALEDALIRGDLDASYNRPDLELTEAEAMRVMERVGNSPPHAYQLRGKHETDPKRSETDGVMRRRVRDAN